MVLARRLFRHRQLLLEIFLIEPGTMFFTNERQYVEYRFTYPAVLKDQSEKEISSFLSELTWPTK